MKEYDQSAKGWEEILSEYAPLWHVYVREPIRPGGREFRIEEVKAAAFVISDGALVLLMGDGIAVMAYAPGTWGMIQLARLAAAGKTPAP